MFLCSGRCWLLRCKFHIATATAGDAANLTSLQELLHLVRQVFLRARGFCVKVGAPSATRAVALPSVPYGSSVCCCFFRMRFGVAHGFQRASFVYGGQRLDRKRIISPIDPPSHDHLLRRRLCGLVLSARALPCVTFCCSFLFSFVPARIYTQVHDSALEFGPTVLSKLLDSGVVLLALRGAESPNADVSGAHRGRPT